MRTWRLAITVAAVLGLAACGDDDASMDVDSGPTARDAGPGGTDGGPGMDGGPGPGVDAGPMSDAGGGVDGGTAAGWDASLPMGLSNSPATCAKLGYTYADVPNAGHYATARLTPPSFPYTVTRVFYALPQYAGACNADQAHEVRVFTGTGSMPPATPSGVTLPVTASATPTAEGSGRLVELTLGTPVIVGPGESLFIAVQMARATDPLCLAECLDTGVEDRNWWSAGTMTPFPWRTLTSYGNTGTLIIGARND